MSARLSGLLGAIAVAAIAMPAAAAERPLPNGAIERPAPVNPAVGARPVALRPSADLIATLNAIVTTQLAQQDELAAAGNHKLPRPRPDHDQLFRLARTSG